MLFVHVLASPFCQENISRASGKACPAWIYARVSILPALLKGMLARLKGSLVKTTSCVFLLRFKFPEIWRGIISPPRYKTAK
jgi:hypothetical protein